MEVSLLFDRRPVMACLILMKVLPETPTLVSISLTLVRHLKGDSTQDKQQTCMIQLRTQSCEPSWRKV